MSQNKSNRAELTFDSGKIKPIYVDRENENGIIKLSLTTLEDSYTADSGLTYIATIVNTSSSSMKDVRIVPNFGAAEGPAPLVLCGGAALYVNGEYSGSVSAFRDGKSVVFGIALLGAGDNVLVLFKTKISAYAPRELGSSIKNKITVFARKLNPPAVTVVETRVDDYTDVVMFRAETRDDKQSVTTTYTLYNYGNTDAADAVLTDTFSPAPNITHVNAGGETLLSSHYTYVSGTIKLPSAGYKLIIPAASFSRSPSGEVITIPGSKVITVKGTL
ncbi:MAG: hypothetical protein PHW77_02875 [Eubacteriales bacterium]|nr:hypothetical protein [Eubacteriales bacterium]